MNLPDYTQFEQTIGVSFTNKDLLRQAFTHRSFLNEHKEAHWDHNERLEFLGDAVLELVVTHYLYSTYPEKPEGELTAIRAALVNTISLSESARNLSMDDYLLLSKGESKDTGRARLFILANTCEALIGALFLDGGYDSAQSFIKRHILSKTENVVSNELWQDAKSRFQEKAQELTGITPTYQTLKEDGPDHDRHFTVGVFLHDEKIAEGSGQSKQEAEQEAASTALEIKGW